MKCQHCGKNEATFYYRSTVNGHTTEQRLCRHCAEAVGYTEALRPGQWFEDPFFTRPFSLLSGFGSRMLTEFPSPVAMDEKETMPQEEQLLGEKEQRDIVLQVRRNALEYRLKEAIETENYEEAAKVRDELRTLSA